MDMFSNDAKQQALGFVISQTSHIETQVNETIYPDIQYQDLIPVDTSANPFAKSVTYFSTDKFGKAEWVNGNADEIPLAGSEMQKHETVVHMAGVGYGYGYEEVQQAQMLGVNLLADDAAAARRAYEEFVDGVALQGDAAKGFEGLMDYTGVQVTDAATGDWDGGTSTEDTILSDINDLLLGVGTATSFTSMANTLLLPYAKFKTVATSRLGDTGETILEFLIRSNAYTAMTGQRLDIRAVRGLETAGASGENRMLAYRRDPQVLKLHIPMPHRFLPVYQTGALNFVIPGIFRLGGLDVRRPAEVRYADGI